MAALRLTSRERAEVYRQIFLLNRSFDLIVQRLDDLARTRIFSVRDMREVSGLAQEVQLEINTTLLSPLIHSNMTIGEHLEKSVLLWKSD